MHILMVHDRPGATATEGPDASNGVAVYLATVAAALRQSGHRVSDLALKDGLAVADMPHHDRYTLPSVSVRRNSASDTAIIDLVRRLKPDVIHLHATYFVLGAWMNTALRAIAPTLVTMHDITPFCPKKTLLRRDRSICTRSAGLACMGVGCYRPEGIKDLVKLAVTKRKIRGMDHLDHIIAPSRFIKDLCIRNGLPGAKTSVLPNFTRFTPEQTDIPEAKKLLFVGRLSAEKGADLLPDICAQLQTRDWHLDIVGGGALKASLQGAFQRAGLDGQVTFHDHVAPAALADFYSTTRVLVLPYMMPESFGMAGVEALSFARPVTGFAVGGMADWMQEAFGCHPVPRGDTAALAAKIDTLLGEQPKAVPVLPDPFTLATHRDALVTLYSDLANGVLPMTKPRIAHICWNYGGHQEGISRSVTRLASHQVKDWDVHVFAANAADTADVALHHIKLNWLERRLPFLLGFARASARHIQKDGPFDIIHAHVPSLARANVASVHLFPPQQLVDMVRDTLRRTGQPLTKDIQKQFRRARVADWCYGRNMGSGTHVIAVSKAVMRQISTVYKIPAATITCAPLGVDHPTVSHDTTLRTRWGFAPDRPVALFAGHQYVTKGLGFVFEALARLGPRAPALVVIGEGSEGSLAAMQAQVKRLGLEADVRFDGLQKDVTPYLMASDFLVYPTFFDTFGLIITEALAASKPVITTKAAGVVEELASTAPLILLDSPEDVADLAKALDILAHDLDVRRQLGQGAAAALAPLSWDRHANIVAGVYRKALPHTHFAHFKESS